MSARLELDVSVPDRGVHLTLSPRPGVTTAVIGPNGAGKSTLLEAVGGLLEARARIVLDGRDLGGVPAHRRRVGYLRQHPGLFEHLRVRDNVAFGPRAQGMGRRRADARAEALLVELGADHLAERRPRSLSGGQAQRVAIARALATEPALMLLDEPFAALDVDATAQLRALVGTALAGRTALLVTHDLLDVLSLAEDVAVLEAGRVLAVGPRAEILHRPPSAFVARLTGRELARGVLRDGAVVTADGVRIPGAAEGALRDGDDALALIDPAHVALASGDESAPPGVKNRVPLTVSVESVEQRGAHVVLRGGGAAAQLDAGRAAVGLPAVGEEITLLLDPARIPLYAPPA